MNFKNSNSIIMSLRNLKYSIFSLSFITLFISFYLTKLSYSTSMYCPIFNGCDLVLTSKYNKIFGIPISVFGIIYSLLLIILFYIKKTKILLLISPIGTTIALILLYIQFFILKAICFYCTIADIIFVIIFVLLLIYFKKFER